MKANLSPAEAVRPQPNWGPLGAGLGLLLAFGIQLVLAVPVIIVDRPGAGGHFSTAAMVVLQIATAFSFVAAPLLIASRGGNLRTALTRLGVRPFRPAMAARWMVIAVIGYLALAATYTALFGPHEQKDIAKDFGAAPVQILLIVIAAPISEEVCFRGMLFGGLRRRLPKIVAALISGTVFGLLHANTGLGVVPVLVGLGVIFALLYEKTGSIVPGIILHALNNSFALLSQ